MILLEALPTWAVFLATGGLVFGSLQAGYSIGRRRKQTEGKADSAGAMVGATMGLLAFMLAFTFNGAAARHDARKMLVIDEANAIDQAWLRAGFLPEADRLKARATLREYVDVRVKASLGEIEIQAGLADVETLLDELWGIAEIAGRASPASIATGQFVDSANAVIELHLKRLTIALRTRVPPTIWTSLYVLVCAGMFMMGLANGRGAGRQLLVELGLALAFSIVLFVIVDLDRPQEGLINVSQQAMTELRDKIDAR